MSLAEFPIGARVRIPDDREPRYRSCVIHGERYLVIGEPWLVKGETELMLDGEVTHPDWTCIPLVIVCLVTEARDYYSRYNNFSDDQLCRKYFGPAATVYFADVSDLVVDDAVPA
jgi:hypothetical protein